MKEFLIQCQAHVCMHLPLQNDLLYLMQNFVIVEKHISM